MEYIIGISLGYNASACIVDETHKVLYAASEERFTNVKNCKQFPLLAIKNGIEYLNIDPKDIVGCYYSHYQAPDIYDLYRHTYNIDTKLPKRQYEAKCDGTYRHMEKDFIINHLFMLGIKLERYDVFRVGHHEAHALCSYNLTPFHSKTSSVTNLYVVMDGFGDGRSISAFVEACSYDREVLRWLDAKPMRKSIALLYQFVTGALGYKEHQHEGKITGLAAYGDKHKYYEAFMKLYNGFEDIKPDRTIESPIIDFDIFTEMKKRTYSFVNDCLEGMSKEELFEESKHIAASLQAVAEDLAIHYVRYLIHDHRYRRVNLMLSGGLFANVKINQRIHEEIPEVENIFIAPPMGDEGTCIGAASSRKIMNNSKTTLTNMTMRMGTSHTIEEVLESVSDDLQCEKIIGVDEVSKAIANDLKDNKIVCLFDGRMEFGPRALIGRSIMYNCRDVGANDWLNKQLGRTEFMPFAPFCKEEHATDLFHNVEGKEYALKNMTITVNCSDEFIRDYPAACHIDNTARPQVISHDENKLAWTILDEYEALTGEKALINTSFNLHNYPIIESPKVAIDSWKQSNTHSLYIGCEGEWFKITRK